MRYKYQNVTTHQSLLHFGVASFSVCDLIWPGSILNEPRCNVGCTTQKDTEHKWQLHPSACLAYYKFCYFKFTTSFKLLFFGTFLIGIQIKVSVSMNKFWYMQLMAVNLCSSQIIFHCVYPRKYSESDCSEFLNQVYIN